MLTTAGAEGQWVWAADTTLLPDTCILIGRGHWQRASSAGPQGECRAGQAPPGGRPVISPTRSGVGPSTLQVPRGRAAPQTLQAFHPTPSRALRAQARDPRWVGHSCSSAPKGAYHLWNS